MLFATLDSKPVRAMPEKARGDFLASVALCAHYLDRPKDIQRYAMAATKLGDNPVAWRLRLLSEMRSGSHEDALSTIETMEARLPKLLADLPVRWIEQFYRKMKERNQDELQLRLLTVIGRPEFQFSDDIRSIDWMLADYATILNKAGQPDQAAQIVARVTDPGTLRNLSLTPGLRELFPATFNSRAAVEAELERYRALARKNPDRTEVLLDVARMQRSLGKPEDALKTLMEADPAQTNSKFVDADAMANWWWNDISTTYRQLARDAEAEAALRRGIAMGESNQTNVSQTINLASRYETDGRYEDALAVLGGIGPTITQYGLAAWRTIKSCSLAKTGKRSAALAEFAQLRKLGANYPGNLLEAQVCLEDYDAAAETLVRGLKDPKRIPDMLLLLSEFDSLPANRPLSALDLGLDKLRQRPEVSAAIAAAGGTRRFRVVD